MPFHKYSTSTKPLPKRLCAWAHVATLILLLRIDPTASVKLVHDASGLVAALQSPTEAYIIMTNDISIATADWPLLPILVDRSVMIEGVGKQPTYYVTLDLQW